MTTREARRVADLRWGTESSGAGGRIGIVRVVKHRKTPPKFLVGYKVRGGSETLMGSGSSFVDAFADAARRSQP